MNYWGLVTNCLLKLDYYWWYSANLSMGRHDDWCTMCLLPPTRIKARLSPWSTYKPSRKKKGKKKKPSSGYIQYCDYGDFVFTWLFSLVFARRKSDYKTLLYSVRRSNKSLTIYLSTERVLLLWRYSSIYTLIEMFPGLQVHAHRYSYMKGCF